MVLADVDRRIGWLEGQDVLHSVKKLAAAAGSGVAVRERQPMPAYRIPLCFNEMILIQRTHNLNWSEIQSIKYLLHYVPGLALGSCRITDLP